MEAGEEVGGSRVVTMVTMEGAEPSMESNSITIPDSHQNERFHPYHDIVLVQLRDKRSYNVIYNPHI